MGTDEKIWNLFTLKAFSENRSIIVQMKKFVCKFVGIHVEKEEILVISIFLLSQCFQNPTF